MMFVTHFLGIFNIVTGELEYCNGGRNPSYLLSPENPGIALVIMNDFSFSANRITLTPGETLFVFTDCVTEAMNNCKELFTNPHLEKILAPPVTRPVCEIAEHIMIEIDTFAAGAPQTSDITMLVLRYTKRTTPAP